MSRENNFLETEHSITEKEIARLEKATDRRTEIARLKTFNLYILALSFCLTWGAFYLQWAYWLKPFWESLPATLLVGGVTGLYYLNTKRINDPKIQRLMKYDILFDSFFEAMIREMERNDAEKGDSWRTTLNLEDLRKLQTRTWGELQTVSNQKSVSAHFERQPKLANYCAMIFLRIEMDFINEVLEERPV